MLKYTFQDECKKASAYLPPQNIEMENGFLVVRAMRQDGTSLPGATVQVVDEDGNGTERTLHTDQYGRTQKISISAPAAKYSLTETSIVVPYANVTIRVSYHGYYTNVYKNAQIFARTLTEQDSNMVPLPKGVRNAPEKIFTIPPPAVGGR